MVNLGSNAVANTLPAGGALALLVLVTASGPAPAGFRGRADALIVTLGAIACLTWRHAPALIRSSR